VQVAVVSTYSGWMSGFTGCSPHLDGRRVAVADRRSGGA
jgi:hypothetical protein